MEAIANTTLTNLRVHSPRRSAARSFSVPVRAAGNDPFRPVRQENQQVSLVSFAADAYVNEMGITSPLRRTN